MEYSYTGGGSGKSGMWHASCVGAYQRTRTRLRAMCSLGSVLVALLGPCRKIRTVIRLVGRDRMSVGNGLGPAAALGRPDTLHILERSALRSTSIGYCLVGVVGIACVSTLRPGASAMIFGLNCFVKYSEIQLSPSIISGPTNQPEDNFVPGSVTKPPVQSV